MEDPRPPDCASGGIPTNPERADPRRKRGSGKWGALPAPRLPEGERSRMPERLIPVTVGGGERARAPEMFQNLQDGETYLRYFPRINPLISIGACGTPGTNIRGLFMKVIREFPRKFSLERPGSAGFRISGKRKYICNRLKLPSPTPLFPLEPLRKPDWSSGRGEPLPVPPP